MNRLLRIIKHRWAILIGKADLEFEEPPLGPKHLPKEWISNKIMDKNVMVYNLGYSEKYKGYLVVVTPIQKNNNNS